MADLTDLQAATTVKIVGSDSTGVETSAVGADINGNLFVKDYSDGPVSPGTAASVSNLVGGQFNTVLPILTNTQQSSMQLDSSGRLIISPTTQGILAEDHNWGTVGANTLRVAAEVGNQVGIADFNAGATTAQTLRVASDTYDFAGNGITSASNGFAANRMLHAQAPDTTTASTALGALNAVVSIVLAGLDTVGFQILAGTLIGTLTPQCSVDGGTTWTTAYFYNPVNNVILNTFIFSIANTTQVLSILPIGGASNVRVIVTAYTSGTANAILRATKITGIVANLTDGLKSTYSTSTKNQTVAASATDIFTIIGSATKIVRVLRIGISGTQSTTGNATVQLFKRDNPDTGGTSNTPTIISFDSTNATATAVVRGYTANPTLGSPGNNFQAVKVFFPNTSGNAEEKIWDFTRINAQTIVLRGVNEQLALNLDATTMSGSNLDCWVEWTEE